MTTPIEQRTTEAQQVLVKLNFDPERANERSALVLLALLGLGPSSPWASSNNPSLRTVELMAWLRKHYQRDYKPNTRETIRRQTLHQFIEAGLVQQNPDEPGRAVNSPKNCYQIVTPALKVLSVFGTDQFDPMLARYLEDLPGLQAQYERSRIQNLTPVTLPGGDAVRLTPGGQNLLIRQMVEQFCPRFTPGAQVLYVGDAGREDPIFEQKALADLGVVLDKHGKLPDLIVHMPDREWLVLMEAAASHGPVDGKRRDELERLFMPASSGLVFVSCFPSRQTMRKYVSQIAWETEVWCADNPSHLIHFNGERFLGPYE
jgi:adenine-specific DNA-methyltransferase